MARTQQRGRVERVAQPNAPRSWVPGHKRSSNTVTRHHSSSSPAPTESQESGRTLPRLTTVCNDLNGAGLVLDGSGGPATSSAWCNLNYAMGTWCLSPEYNTSHWQIILDMIMRHGFGNKTAGHWVNGACPPVFP